MTESINRLLKSLCPQSDEDMGLFSSLVRFAREFVQHAQGDLALAAQATPSRMDLAGFFASLSEESQHYFFGLVEALEIYNDFRGEEALDQLFADRTRIEEIRQIRDHCLSGIVSPVLSPRS